MKLVYSNGQVLGDGNVSGSGTANIPESGTSKLTSSRGVLRNIFQKYLLEAMGVTGNVVVDSSATDSDTAFIIEI